MDFNAILMIKLLLIIRYKFGYTVPNMRDHKRSCVQGAKYSCKQCGREYVTKQGLRHHTRVIHGPKHPAPDDVFVCPHCSKQYVVKKSMREHSITCSQNPNKKGPSTVGWRAVNARITLLAISRISTPIWPLAMGGRSTISEVLSGLLVT